MTQGFFQFNNSIINEIINFATSSFDLLLMHGPKGSSKSETIEKTIPQLQENNLVFQHFCFENTVIDDFLLNFYDALRNFSLSQKISLKKYTSDNFKEKVSHYFKTISTNCIVVIENFEKVDGNVEIIDFLSHLVTYENVKVIIVSRNDEKHLFSFKKIKVKNLELKEISKEDFKSKLTVLTEPMEENLKEKFYTVAQGLELYLKMSIKYCSVAGISIEDLINEFERKNETIHTDYEEFIISKFISITPSIYKDFFKIFCSISHPVNMDFINEYKFGNTSYIEYLSKNFLINKFKNEYYVKDYFKSYIVKTFSIKEKMTYYNRLIEIYQNELTKSPKDRLLRLSRESIRKEIEYLESLIPSINSTQKNQETFSYLGIANSSWHDEKLRENSKLAEKLNKIKERKKAISKEENDILIAKRLEESNQKSLIDENNEKNRLYIISLINSARNFAKEYKYQETISELTRALTMDSKEEFHIEILTLLAKNHEQINKTDIALTYYQKALELAIEKRDLRKPEIEFSIALINKNLYKIDIAKSQFKQIVNNEANHQNYRAKACIELAELEEANSQIEKAIGYYEKALELSVGKNKNVACCAYYKLAILYDENQDAQNAIKYYQKNYTTSSDIKENKYYSASLTNLALINIEQSKYKDAKDYLKLALIFDSENNDLENMYFAQKELAKLYARTDETQAIKYFKQALDSAKKLNDIFKEALVHFEAGEFYYDRQEDEKALVNFLNSKVILKNSNNEENIARIDSRIKDIKIRLSENSFNIIMEKYAGQF